MIAIEGEEWHEVPEPYDRYLASTRGRCYNVKTRHLLLPTRMPDRRNRAQRPDAYRLHRTGGHKNGSGLHYMPIGSLVWRTFVGPVGAGFLVEQVSPGDGWYLGNLRKVNAITRLRVADDLDAC